MYGVPFPQRENCITHTHTHTALFLYSAVTWGHPWLSWGHRFYYMYCNPRASRATFNQCCFLSAPFDKRIKCCHLRVPLYTVLFSKGALHHTCMFRVLFPECTIHYRYPFLSAHYITCIHCCSLRAPFHIFIQYSNLRAILTKYTMWVPMTTCMHNRSLEKPLRVYCSLHVLAFFHVDIIGYIYTALFPAGILHYIYTML